MLMVYELITIGTGLVGPRKWAILYTFNMIRGLGAIVWMVKDIKVRGTIPSLGVVLVMLALFVSCGLPTTWTGFHSLLALIGHVVSCAGAGLYAVNGILSIVYNGFPRRYITVVVMMGCPDGLQYSGLFDNTPVYCPALQPSYEFKDSPRTAFFPEILWIIGLEVVFGFSPLVILVHLLNCIRPSLRLSYYAHPSQLFTTRWRQRTRNTDVHANGKKVIIYLCILLTSLGALATVMPALIMTLGAKESFIDCRNAQEQSYSYTGCNQTSISLSASPSGYFTTWSKYWEAIVRSMFVW
jgi:hypothetical protein